MHFVIAGLINCPQFAYAVMVAQRLKENLPDFTYLKIPKKPEEWEKWLVNICQENEWYHVQSPLIWREIVFKKGRKDFIGDINKFLDLCYDYYGIPRNLLSAENFNRGEMNWFTNRNESEFFENVKLEASRKRAYRSRQVCITGASSQMTEILIMELLQLQIQRRENGLEIRLFDEPMKEKKLASTANDAKHCSGASGFGNCRVAATLQEALTNVDLVIVLDCFARKASESLVRWLKRNRNAMCALGRALNLYAPTHCRVIIGSPSTQPLCYNATVLASFATKLHARNIVAVTQDLGREMLKALSTKINVPLRDFYCPPVWGFVGLNKFIDVRRTLQRHLYKVPGKNPNSTLPQGVEQYELRTTDCLISEDQVKGLHIDVSKSNAECYPHLGRWPCLAKVTAILDLLKVWGLKQEDGNGEILSLGVYSDGTFNIPQGIYWSQPVILINGFWVPFADFPIPRLSSINLYYLFVYSVAALYRTRVKPRIYVPPKRVKQPKEGKKFDFEKLVEEVGMPVIRTDPECMNYLKFLAKKELGIDFDAFDDTLEEEESIPEVVPQEEAVQREKIYCECWRLELKELQKIVFDRSSTTEVEVDLSENVSGSEWSIINPNPEVSASSSTKGSSSKDSNITQRFDSGTVREGEVMQEKDEKPIESPSSPSMVCSCGALSNGSICQCLVPEVREEEKISTEHFYKEQNAQIFEDDLKDALYADSYVAEKHVTFDAEAKTEDETGFHVEFHGRKDAIRDEKADALMKKRILRYERGGEESIDEEQSTKEDESSSTNKSEETVKDAKFQISVQGASYDIIGDQDGLEQLDEMRKAGMEDSSASFSKMYKDRITPILQIIPNDDTMMESSSERESMMGEKDEEKPRGYYFPVVFPEITGEVSMGSFKEFLYSDEGLFDRDEFSEEGEDKKEVEEKITEEPPKKEKRKREGIPLCCLCRCIVPEGLPCCPCGTTTVVEVFKKESVEVIIYNEDDMSYRIEYHETTMSGETMSSYEASLPDIVPPDVMVKHRDLPPESFFPFSPKVENKFVASARPPELQKQELDPDKKTYQDIPERCRELLEMAKMQLEEENLGEEEERVVEEEEEEGGRTRGREGEINASEKLSEEEEEEGKIKTDFSDLLMFIPEGIEDWRLTVQRKYREWFFQGPKIRDECYYDIAIEDVSEDEFDIDKEMEIYFEN